MLLADEYHPASGPQSHHFEIFADPYEGYYDSNQLMPTMCFDVFGGSTMMEDARLAVAFSQEESSQSSSVLYPHMTTSSPSQHEALSRSPSVSSDGGKPLFKPQYTAELDVLCRICGDRASGFHYGVHSCEGCKGFFRRTLKKSLVYKPCQMGSQCKIDMGTRNKCQYCRYQRCLNAGMSQDAVRFGRCRSGREKLLADKEELMTTCGKRIVELRSLTDLIKAAFRDIFINTIFFARENSRAMIFNQSEGQCVNYDDLIVVECLSSEEFFEKGIFTQYQELIVPVLEASVKFAKKLPGFTNMSMADQICLMKTNGFMVVQIALHMLIDKDYINFVSRRNAFRLSRLSPYLCTEIQKLLERTICVGDRLHNMQLTAGEIALFCGILLTSECPGLQNVHQAEQVQSDLIDALRLELKHNHPKDKLMLPKLLVLIPDLCQIVDEFSRNLQNHLFDHSHNFSSVQPLLQEIFDIEAVKNKNA
uniref:Peroxisome proliferator-activated receptor n=1 Tax=Patella depressa TaxID=87960 RepID=A0A890C9P1_PATDE|nr:peroxisome proliferator-activated receptor [Patella depressa]